MKKEHPAVSRQLLCGLFLVLIFGVFAFRLAQWQLIEGADFLKESEETSSSFVVKTAARGEILDKDGNPLATNRTTYNLLFNSLEFKRATMNETIHALIALTEACNAKWVDRLPIQIDASGNYQFKEDSETEIDYMKSASMLRMNEYATAEDCVNAMCSGDFYNITGYSDEDALKIASVRYNMQRSQFSASYPYTFAEDLPIDAVTVISEYISGISGVSIEVSTTREYSVGTLAPHLVGMTGLLSAEEYDTLKEEGKTYSSENIAGYAYNDKIGKSGIEAALEEELRGTNGKIVLETDAEGNLLDSSEKSIAPNAGNTVYLTLDSNLQAVANASLAKNVKAAQSAGKEAQEAAIAAGSDETVGFGEDCTSGAAVVLRVKDFAVLASSTYPTYDLNKSLSDAAYYEKVLNDKRNPLFNRAMMGTYTPGSIFKPAVALAALQESAITSGTEIYCSGRYHNEDFADYTPGCLGVHGDTTVFTAIEKSCNIFFYETGYRLGIRSLTPYCSLLGLGEKTGIELPESTGILANPDEYKEVHNADWTDGITVQAAIGQSDNSFTPLQLATYAATIANNGVRLRTHLVDKVTDYTRETVLSQTEPEVMAELGVDQAYLDDVKYAMSLVTTDGGTGARFSDYGVKIAAKTGTATTVEGVHSDNVTFIAFAPYEDPEIAVAVVLEYGARGTYSMNIAEDIFDAYFYGKTVDQNGDLVMPDSKPNED